VYSSNLIAGAPGVWVHVAVGVENRVLVRPIFGSRSHQCGHERGLPREALAREDHRTLPYSNDSRLDEDVLGRM
jgi:hypothetical protein